jgi:hypothetical protein
LHFVRVKLGDFGLGLTDAMVWSERIVLKQIEPAGL